MIRRDRLMLPAAFSQFLRFSAVGALGFMVDSAVLYLLIYGAGLGPLLARVPSFLSASAFTWLANRIWTYSGPHHGSMAGQWARFVTVNALGGVVNLTVYGLLVGDEPFRSDPVLAVAAGSVSGLIFNFCGSRRFVFGRS